jgi:hypothetical protein
MLDHGPECLQARARARALAARRRKAVRRNLRKWSRAAPAAPAVKFGINLSLTIFRFQQINF